jgi:hypothetical protein
MLWPMRRALIIWIAVLALAAPVASGSLDPGDLEFPLAKKKQNFGSAKYNCKNRRTYADYVRCGFI